MLVSLLKGLSQVQHGCKNRPEPPKPFKNGYCGYLDKQKDDACNGCRLKFNGWNTETGEKTDG